MTSRVTSATLAEECRTLIPGFDPWATAGDCTFDAEWAAHCVGFFPTCLAFVEGERAGTPFVLEPWQRAIVGNLFGWLRPDGSRRFRETLIYVARKNGKTMFCSGLILMAMMVDEEPGAQLFAAAADREQASLIFKDAARMIEAQPLLADRMRVFRGFKSIERPDTGAVFKALSSESYTKHGLGPHIVIVDELHAHPNADLVEVLLTGTGARRQPIIVYITTADYDRDSICNTKYDYACKVRDGIMPDSSFLPVIYEAAPDDDWTAPETWAKANPNLGVSVRLDYLERECLRAQQEPTYENTFKRLHLNIRTQQDIRWIPIEKWDACREHFTADDMAGRECWAGLDMSATTDLTAFVMVFPMDSEGDRYRVLPYFWVPEDRARDRERKDRVPYVTWINRGLIRATPGNVVDYDRVRADIVGELAQTYNIREIAIDRWNSTQMQTQLMGDGMEVVQFGQGFASMSAPTKEWEKLIVGRQLGHDGNPVLRWMMSNVAVTMDAAGNVKPDKGKATERIDGVVAGIMGLGRAMIRDRAGSVYESRGVMLL